ncbi:hypothetical protein [Saccharopolyspora rosea]|uniref:Uncharacterized protein n=1 Tax=Saccharopolyspora rosea TaxID=524884 RepID=A0ABW3FIN0_9PSEU|nr:hypothetical protein [Saccharopolyspora rosea]
MASEGELLGQALHNAINMELQRLEAGKVFQRAFHEQMTPENHPEGPEYYQWEKDDLQKWVSTSEQSLEELRALEAKPAASWNARVDELRDWFLKYNSLEGDPYRDDLSYEKYWSSLKKYSSADTEFYAKLRSDPKWMRGAWASVEQNRRIPSARPAGIDDVTAPPPAQAPDRPGAGADAVQGAAADEPAAAGAADNLKSVAATDATAAEPAVVAVEPVATSAEPVVASDAGLVAGMWASVQVTCGNVMLRTMGLLGSCVRGVATAVGWVARLIGGWEVLITILLAAGTATFASHVWDALNAPAAPPPNPPAVQAPPVPGPGPGDNGNPNPPNNSDTNGNQNSSGGGNQNSPNGADTGGNQYSNGTGGNQNGTSGNQNSNGGSGNQNSPNGANQGGSQDSNSTGGNQGNGTGNQNSNSGGGNQTPPNTGGNENSNGSTGQQGGCSPCGGSSGKSGGGTGGDRGAGGYGSSLGHMNSTNCC